MTRPISVVRRSTNAAASSTSACPSAIPSLDHDHELIALELVEIDQSQLRERAVHLDLVVRPDDEHLRHDRHALDRLQVEVARIDRDLTSLARIERKLIGRIE